MENNTLKHSILNKVILQGFITLMLLGSSVAQANNAQGAKGNSCDYKDQWGNCSNAPDGSYSVSPPPPLIPNINWNNVYQPAAHKRGVTGTISCNSGEVTVKVLNGYWDTCIPNGQIVVIVSNDGSNFDEWVIRSGNGKFEHPKKDTTKLRVSSSNGTILIVESISKSDESDNNSVKIISKYGKMGCLQFDFQVQLGTCNSTFDSQKWFIEIESGHKLIKKNDRCLTVVNEYSSRPHLQLENCNNKSTQKWIIDTNWEGWSSAKIELEGGIVLTLDANYNVVMDHEVLGGSDSQLWKIIK